MYQVLLFKFRRHLCKGSITPRHIFSRPCTGPFFSALTAYFPALGTGPLYIVLGADRLFSRAMALITIFSRA